MLISQTVGGLGGMLSDESKIRNCCNKYLANDCTDISVCCGYIDSNDPSADECISMEDIINEADDYTIEQAKALCNCPNAIEE